MIINASMNRKQRLDKNIDLVVEMRHEFADTLGKCLNFSSMVYLP
jgi:hypothetical protein